MASLSYCLTKAVKAGMLTEQESQFIIDTAR